MGTPAKPDVFDFRSAPAGIEVKFITFLADRPVMREKPRMIAVHTNGAGGEGSIQSAWNWAHAAPGSNTIPHYQVDRNGKARKFLPSNVRGIANSTVLPSSSAWSSLSKAEQNAILEHPVRSAEWSLAIETADTGYIADPTISDFTPAQAETVATIIAYESIVCDFPIEVPDCWYGAGVCAHTDPFPYPFHTIAKGKICPGDKKKASVRERIIPRARQIASAWQGATPVPPTPAPIPIEEDDDMAKLYLARLDTNQYHYRRGDGNVATILRSKEYAYLKWLFDNGAVAPVYHDPLTGAKITGWGQVPVLNETCLDLWVGYLDGNSLADEG